MAIVGQGITAYPQPDDALNENSKNPVQNKVVAKEVNELKNAFHDVSALEPIAVRYAIDGAGYVKWAAGDIGSSSVTSHTDYVDVSCYEFLLYKRQGLTGSSSPAGIAFYDENKAYISGESAVGKQSQLGYLEGLQRASVPEGAKFARFSVYTDTTTYGNFELLGSTKIAHDVSELKSAVDAANQPFVYSLYGGYLDTSGFITNDTTSNNSKFTDYLRVQPGELIKIQVVNPDNNNIWVVAGERDSEYGSFHRRDIFSYLPEWDTRENAEKIYIVPENVCFVSFSFRAYENLTVVFSRTINDIAVKVESSEHVNNVKPHAKVYSINHRGWHECPENTLAAFRESAKRGFERVETDVRVTSDGVPVLLHDAAINRTARNADGSELSETINIADITYQQALQYDFGIYKGSEFAGEKIPSLEDFLKLCRNTGLMPYVELQSTVQTGEPLNAVAAVVRASAIADNVTFLSNYSTALVNINKAFPSNRIGICPFTYTPQFLILANALKNGKAEIFFDISHDQITPGLVQELSRQGYPLEAWVVDSESAIVNADKYITGFTSNTLNAAAVLKNAALS